MLKRFWANLLPGTGKAGGTGRKVRYLLAVNSSSGEATDDDGNPAAGLGAAQAGVGAVAAWLEEGGVLVLPAGCQLAAVDCATGEIVWTFGLPLPAPGGGPEVRGPSA